MGKKLSSKHNSKKRAESSTQTSWYQKNLLLRVIYYIPLIYINFAFKIYLFLKNASLNTYQKAVSYSRSLGVSVQKAFNIEIRFNSILKQQKKRGRPKKHKSFYSVVAAKLKAIGNYEINLPTHYIKLFFYYITYPARIVYRIFKAITSFEIKVRLFSFGTFALVGFLGLVYVSSLLYFAVFEDIPSPDSLARIDPRLTTTIYDRRGNVLYKVFNDEDRSLVALNDIPSHLINATLAIEDQTFYEHHGLSFRGIARAARRTFLENGLEGGSTITQQLIKNTLLTPDRTYQRKAREAVLAIEIERRYSKPEILEMYLNQISYGGTSYGVKSAAKRYFGKEVSELNLAESSFLAGLPAAPSRYSPFVGNLESGKQRQRMVLERMMLSGYITASEASEAYDEELVFQSPSERMVAPHFVHYVISELEQKYGQMMVLQGGMDVFTSIDLEVQTNLERIVRNNVNQLTSNNVTNGAAVITNPQSGEILAMVGSTDYWDVENEGNFNVTTSLRQPGSSIKPLTYSLALESGQYTINSIIDDSPITYTQPGGQPYTPVNYDGSFRGNITFKSALAGSYNIPAVKILDAIGVENLVQHGRKMGITTWEDGSRFGLSLTLGAGEVKMTDMAVLYGVFANQGFRTDLDPLLRVYDSFGNILHENNCVDFLHETPSILTNRTMFETRARAAVPSTTNLDNPKGVGCVKEQVISGHTAYLMTQILTDNRARAAAFGSNSELNVTQKEFAVKTGTTNSLKDNWAIGYNDDYVIVTWIGNNNNEVMRNIASGYNGSSTIWRQAVDYLISNKEVSDTISRPANLVEVDVCTLTDTLSCEGCPTESRIYRVGDEPTQRCSPEEIQRILNPVPVSTEAENADNNEIE